ncbi:MAG: hypothetical protein ACOYEO_04935 [bacterium]|jgi:hypothetical protein
MKKVATVSSEATFAVHKVLQKKQGDNDLLSRVRIIVPIRPRSLSETKRQLAAPVLRWLIGD